MLAFGAEAVALIALAVQGAIIEDCRSDCTSRFNI